MIVYGIVALLSFLFLASFFYVWGRSSARINQTESIVKGDIDIASYRKYVLFPNFDL